LKAITEKLEAFDERMKTLEEDQNQSDGFYKQEIIQFIRQ
jgi:hypothetical protein